MKAKFLAFSAAALAAVCGNVLADAIPDNFTLPPGFVTYGDAQSYSLQIACTQGNFQPPSSCPFLVRSGVGQLNDLLVVFSGPNSTVGANSQYQGIDLNYLSPNNEGGKIFFQMGATISNNFSSLGGPLTYQVPDPANGAGALGSGSGFVDLRDAWDVTLGTLHTFLTGNNTTSYGDPVFFFNNNNEGSGGTFKTSEDLAVWAKVWVTDAFGNPVTDASGNSNGYDLTNNLGPYGTFPNGGGVLLGSVIPYISPIVPGGQPRIADWLLHTDYVKSGGEICFDQVGAQPAFGDIPVPCSGAFDYFVSNNLGSNQAAYAVVFPELNSLLAALYTQFGNNPLMTLHVDVRMGCDPARSPGEEDCTSFSLNGGFEQLFIGRLASTTVPEPGTLLLIGLGVALIGWTMRRRKR